MYSVGDYISYGNSGVCEVMGTEVMDPSIGTAVGRICYILRPLHDQSCKIMTPVDNPKVTMRDLISPEETRKLLEDIPQIETLPEQSARQQEISYSKALPPVTARMAQSGEDTEPAHCHPQGKGEEGNRYRRSLFQGGYREADRGILRGSRNGQHADQGTADGLLRRDVTIIRCILH